MKPITLDKLLSRQAKDYRDSPFFTLGSSQLTYKQVDQQASRVAAGLQSLGLQPGDRLAVILPNIPEFGVSLFAAARAGLLLVPINIRRGPKEVKHRLSKTLPRALVTFSDSELFDGVDHLDMILEMKQELPDLEHVIALNGEQTGTVRWQDLLGSQSELSEATIRADNPVAIIHTMGSSGQPRGAILTHGGLVRNATGIADGLNSKPDDVFLGAVPFSNTFGLTATILACAVTGAEIACLPKYRPGQALNLIAQNQVTIHHGVPTMFAMELNHSDFDPAACQSIRTGIMSGASCPPSLARRVRSEMSCNLILAYGLTEASPSVSMTRLDDGPVTATETVGRPMEGVEIKVIDPAGRKLANGEKGELCVRGYNVMLGYWDDSDATAKVLDSNGWLHTGDLAVIDPDGPLQIVGRLDEVINRGGFKIDPGMVEMVIRTYPGVKETAVLGVPDLIFGELSVACVVRRSGAAFSDRDLLNYAGEHLADYALPDRIIFFETLPREGSGPVRREYLRSRIRIRGQAWKFGKNLDTDAIIPARHCNTADPHELALHCMEDADPEFVDHMNRGDLIVADSNFGCGSSREVAPLTIKAAGVSAVIAKSFARIFFRNAINIGLPILECPEAVDGIAEGDEIEVEPTSGTIRNVTRNTMFQATAFPSFLQKIIDQGGLLAYVEERLANTEAILSSDSVE